MKVKNLKKENNLTIHILDIRNAILENFKELKVFNKIQCDKKRKPE
jgi:hypothetical protein